MSRPTHAVTHGVAALDGDFVVLGAGGKMGLHVCRMLRTALDERGDRRTVTAVSRFSSLHDRAAFEDHGIPTIQADLADPEAKLPDAANVIYMAGAKFGTSQNSDLLRKINVGVPRLMAERYRDSRIAAYSTGCVYSFAPVESRGWKEDGPTDPPGEYARSCIGREDAFRDGSVRNDTKVALIRLCYAIDPHYGVLVDVARKVFTDEPVNLCTGHVNVIWQRDAVAYSILALQDAASPAWALNVTGPEVVSVQWLGEEFGRRFGKSPSFTGSPQPTAWLVDASMCHEKYGPPETPLAQMIDWIAAWTGQGGRLWNKPTGFEKRDGNF